MVNQSTNHNLRWIHIYRIKVTTMSFDFKSFDSKSFQTLILAPPKATMKFQASTLEELLRLLAEKMPADATHIIAELRFVGTMKRQIATGDVSPPKYDIPMERDPSRTMHTWQEVGNIVENKYKELALTPPTEENDFRLKLKMLIEDILAMFEDYLWLMMTRGDFFAVEWMNRLDPSYHFATEWTPNDDALLTEISNDTRQYFTKWETAIQDAVSEVLRDKAGEPASAIGEAISEAMQSKQSYGIMVARSQLMTTFNRMAQNRYEKAGFDSIWMAAIEDIGTPPCPTCMAKHGHPTSEVGIPPEDSHPDCRCVPIPVKKESI